MSDLENSTLSECASRIGYSFSNPALLRQALIHRSWQAENNDPLTNERFEFLGDAVLGWVIADVAFHRLSDMPEGKLTDLRRSVVNMHALAEIARQLGIGEFLLLGKGEDAAGGQYRKHECPWKAIRDGPRCRQACQQSASHQIQNPERQQQRRCPSWCQGGAAIQLH